MSLSEKLARVWDGAHATATRATEATERTISGSSVAPVAPVAVATRVGGNGANPECAVPSDAIAKAKRYIARAPLTPEAKRARLADLQRLPELARFWLIVWQAEEGDLPNDFGKNRGE